MSFATPSLLFLLWLVPAIGAWWYWIERTRHRALHERMSGTLRRRLCPPPDAWRFVAQLACVLVGFSLLIIALARPQWGTREEKVYQRGRDLMIVLDVSRSMLARDVHPNRLGRAKADLVDLIRELRGDRAGLLAFRGKASLLCPLTTDYAYLKQAMDGVSIHSAPRGTTNIGDAIRRALDAFESDVGAHKAIILISDGEDLSGTAEDAAQAAANRGIPIFAVGLGDSDGARIPSEQKRGDFVKHDGKEVVTRLDHATLESIARITGGAYLPVGSAGLTDNTLGTIYRQHMSRITAQDLEERVRRRHIERYQLFLLPAVILFLATGILSRGRLAAEAPEPEERADPESPQGPPARDPQLRNVVPPPVPLKQLVWLFACMLPVAVSLAQTNGAPQTAADEKVSGVEKVPPGRSGAWIAQKRYRLGRFRAAAEAYQAAADGATKDSQSTFMYNAAVCHFRAGDYDKAVDILVQLTGQSGRDQTDAHYNRAAALYHKAQAIDGETADDRRQNADLLAEAAADLLAAYRRRPDDDQYRRNLAIVESDMFRSRDEAKRAALLERYSEADAFAVADEILKTQRDVLERFPVAFTNRTPERITQIEALAARQRENADRMIPLKAKLQDVVNQAPQDAQDASKAEELKHYLDGTHERLKTSARHLRDLSSDAFEPAARGEGELYSLWKSMAPYDAIIGEDLYRQTNAIRTTTPLIDRATPAARKAIRLQQEEARNLTDRFMEQFQSASLQAAQPIPGGDTAGTNQTLSAEDRQRILDLAAETHALQGKAIELLDRDSLAAALTAQRDSYVRLQEIERLLPKQSQQPNEQPNQEQSSSGQEQSDAGDQQQEQPQEDPEQSPEEDQEAEQDPTEEEETQDEQQASAQEQSREEMDMEEVLRLLQQALLREQEYRQEQERRRQHYDFPGIDRDW